MFIGFFAFSYYCFPKDAKPSDYIRAAGKITNKMKWDGTSSDESKKQLYSIIERFMLKYPDPDSKLLDKELRGAGHTKEECYLNMRYILGDHPGRSDGSYSKEDKKFVEYLRKNYQMKSTLRKRQRKRPQRTTSLAQTLEKRAPVKTKSAFWRAFPKKTERKRSITGDSEEPAKR